MKLYMIILAGITSFFVGASSFATAQGMFSMDTIGGVNNADASISGTSLTTSSQKGSSQCPATVKPVLLAGTSIASLMTAESEVKAVGVTRTVDMKSVTQPVDVSIVGGGCIEIAASGTISIFAHGRYSLGLLDTDKGGSNWKSNGIQVVGGLMFTL